MIICHVGRSSRNDTRPGAISRGWSRCHSLYLDDDDDPEAIERVLRVPALPLVWREYFLKRINRRER
jgi:hypothetical protein